MANNLEFEFMLPKASTDQVTGSFDKQIEAFDEFKTRTRKEILRLRDNGQEVEVPVYHNEFWTAKQRAASSLHEISYRACFKPQLPRFFIERLTKPGELVYDPFMGRGTTLLEAALLNRIPSGNDVNPLSQFLIRPRLSPPSLEAVQQRLSRIDFGKASTIPEALLVFYHPETLRQVASLREYLMQHRQEATWDSVDEWIAMVALNRLTGHSKGFFSVYTLPPNQAVSIKSQIRINSRRHQTPPLRDVPALILKKSRQLLRDVDTSLETDLGKVRPRAIFSVSHARHTPEIADRSVHLVVTSPPFLDVVDYATDNWLRCWFLGIDAQGVPLTVPGGADEWQEEMTAVFHELARVLKPGGHIAFEVGEVDRGRLKLEDIVLPAGMAVGLEPLLVLINTQKFTKTANCWGVRNNERGTNTNRVVVLRKR
jgi:DNA modification methylase